MNISRPADDQSPRAADTTRLFALTMIILLGAAAFAFYGQALWILGKDRDCLYPFLVGDEISYAGILNGGRYGRMGKDFQIHESRDQELFLEVWQTTIPALLMRTMKWSAAETVMVSDFFMTVINMLFLLAVFSALARDRSEALLLALAFFVLFPAANLLIYLPLRGYGFSDWFSYTDNTSLLRFVPAQYTHFVFLLCLAACYQLVRKKNVAWAMGAGFVCGLGFHYRVYDAMVVGNFLGLLWLISAWRRSWRDVGLLTIAYAVLLLVASPVLLKHLAPGDPQLHGQFFERVIVDTIGRGLDWPRLSLFALMTLLLGGAVYRWGTEGADASRREARLLLPVLFTASWIPYAYNVLLGYNLQRPHWLWYHILPALPVFGVLLLVSALYRSVGDGVRRHRILRGLSAALVVAFFLCSFIPTALRGDRFVMPRELKDVIDRLDHPSMDTGVVVTSLFPLHISAYTKQYVYIPYAAFSAVSNLDCLERFLLVRRLLLGERFEEQIAEPLRRPQPVNKIQLQITGWSRFTHFTSHQRSSELKVLFNSYLVQGYMVKPDFPRSYYELTLGRVYPESFWDERTKIGYCYYLSRDAQESLERIAALPLDVDTLVAELLRNRRADYLLLDQSDFDIMSPEWRRTLLSCASLEPIFESGAYRLFRIRRGQAAP